MTLSGFDGERGSTLIGTLVSLSILSVVSVGVVQVMQQVTKSQARANVVRTLQILHATISQAIVKPEAWNQTTQNVANRTTGNMQCIDNDCRPFLPPTVNPIVLLRDATGATVVNTTLGNGFDLEGNPCTGWGTNPQCAFRYSLSWEPSCPPSPVQCRRPDITVYGNLSVSSASQPIIHPINPAHYAIKILRTDVLDFRGVPCLAGQYLAGVKADGSPDCRDFGNNQGTECLPGQVMTGFDQSTGAILCEVPTQPTILYDQFQQAVFISPGFTNSPSSQTGSHTQACPPGYSAISGGCSCENLTGSGYVVMQTCLGYSSAGRWSGWSVSCRKASGIGLRSVVHVMCMRNN